MNNARRLPRPAPLEWVALVGGLFLVNHYAWLLDDAFVYFRYVDNAVLRQLGLVYNAGEYVEGFSSPLWTLLLLGVRSINLDYWLFVRLIGALSFGGFWWLLVLVNRRLSPPDAPVVNAPLMFLTANYGVSCYFTSGLESPLVLLAAGLFAWFFLSPGRGLQVALGLLPLVRHEFLLPVAVAWLFLFLRTRRPPWLLTGAILLPFLSWIIFRIWYYADLFPNTFYLKSATDIPQGLSYLHDTAIAYGLYLLIPGALAVAYWLHRRGAHLHPGPRLWMAAAALPVLVFVVKIGGDPRHFRYLAFPVPLLLIAGAGLLETFLERNPRAWLAPAASAALLLGSLALGPRQLDGHPFTGTATPSIVSKISDAMVHRTHASLRQDPWGLASDLDQRAAYAAHRREHPTRPHTKLEAGWWCATHFRKFDAQVVHALGLTDAILARTEMRADRPAHKEGLKPLAVELGRIHFAIRRPPGPGMYRAAAQQGVAPPWVQANVETIERIAARVYNTHDLGENLRLAFQRVPRVRP